MSKVRNKRTRSGSRPRKRMRRNVKKQQEGFIFPTPLATLLSLVVVLSLAYLWLCGRNESLAKDIRKLELELEQVRKDVVNEEYKWSAMITPKSLQRQIHRYDIDMDWPRREQVVKAGRIDQWMIGDPVRASRQLVVAEARSDRP